MENILDLEAIWERFGSQVGTENEAKMNTKRHAKNDAKMMGGWLRPGWGGVYPFPSLGNPKDLDRAGRGTLEILIATSWPSCCPSFFHRFFNAFFARFWLHFASQLGPQNPPKSIKNRCSNRLPFCFCFLIVFWSVFAPKLAPRKPKNHQKTIGFIVFFAKSAFRS